MVRVVSPAPLSGIFEDASLTILLLAGLAWDLPGPRPETPSERSWVMPVVIGIGVGSAAFALTSSEELLDVDDVGIGGITLDLRDLALTEPRTVHIR